jgi:hypothetical protein
MVRSAWGLLPGLVLRQCQQCQPPLPQRGRRGHCLRLAEHLPAAAGPQRCVDAHLFSVAPQLLEPVPFDGARGPTVQLGQRRRAPQGQRLIEDVRRPLGLGQYQQLTTQYRQLNPAQLRRDIMALQDRLLKLVRTTNAPLEMSTKAATATQASADEAMKRPSRAS